MSEIVKPRLEVAQAAFDELKAKYDAALEVRRLAHKEYGWALKEYEATALKPLFEAATEELRLARIDAEKASVRGRLRKPSGRLRQASGWTVLRSTS